MEFPLPGPGLLPYLPRLLDALTPSRPQQATEQTQAEYEAEQAYRNPEALWDQPFGETSSSMAGPVAPLPPVSTPPAPTLPPTIGGGGSSSAPPPTVSPGPTQPPPYRPDGPPLPPARSGPTPMDAYREQASRSRADSGIRSGRGRVIDQPPPGGWSFILRGLGGIAGVVGGIGGLLWPSPMETGVLTPEQVEEAERAGRAEAERETAELERALDELARAREQAWPMNPVPMPPIAPMPTPQPPVFVSPRPAMTNTPAPSARPAPQPTPQSMPRSQTVTPQQNPLWRFAPLVSLLAPTRTSSWTSMSSPTMPLDPLTPMRPPFGDPLTPGMPNPFTPGMPAPSGLTPFNRPPLESRTDRCRCKKCKEPKKRKSRKCLERAQLSWRTGRKKGQPAGSRCVRFATK